MEQIKKVAVENVSAIVLREKDLAEDAYEELAKQVLQIGAEHQTPIILHSFVEVAKKLGSRAIHLPLPVLRGISKEERAWFTTLGASCHSIEEAQEAERLGCTYITAGHVFETDCKKGLPGRGITFLKEICERISIPVYALGGISPDRMEEISQTRVKGVCVMSGAMQCENVHSYVDAFKEKEHGI